MAITLGLVEAIDSNGVYVSMPGSRGVLRGPYEATADAVVGVRVLLAGTDDGQQVVAGVVGEGDMVNVRAFGAKGDGVTDDTAAIQGCLDAVAALGGGTVYVPRGRYMIAADYPDTSSLNYLRDEGGIALADNLTLVLDPAATLCAIPTAEPAYNVVRIFDKSNVTVCGGTIEGDLGGHLGVSGEWGHGIAVTGGSGITIRDVTVRDCWGDGINVQRLDGTLARSLVTSDLRIDNVTCADNRRQGMSLEGVIGAYITGSTFTGTSGTAPSAGVDIEPWEAGTPSEDIVFHGCSFTDNDSSGLLILGDGVRGVTADGCLFSGNGDSEAQVKSYTDGGQGVRILNSRIVAGAGGEDCIRLQGGTGNLVAGNHVNGRIYLIDGPDDAIRKTTVRDNIAVYDATPEQPSYWLACVTGEDVTFAGNRIDATDDQSTASKHGVYVAGSERVAIVGNSIAGVTRGISVADSSAYVEILDNSLDNNGTYAIGLTGVADCLIARNTIAGACGDNDSSPSVYMTSGATGVRVIDNLFIEDPRISGAGTGRVWYVLSGWDTGVLQDLVTRGNRVVGSGMVLTLPAAYLGAPLTTGYAGDERGLMCDTTGQRPTAPATGTAYYDTTLAKHITYNGTVWKDGTNTTV